MQESSRKRYALFLQSSCGYACGDHEASAFGRKLLSGAALLRAQQPLVGAGNSAEALHAVPAVAMRVRVR